jgi:phage gp29-like protein
MARAQQQQQPNELILPVFTQWERVGSVTGILADLEQGQFYSASLLVEQMMRDDRVRALVNTLIMSVLGCESTWTPSDAKATGEKPTAKAQRFADELSECWDQMVPEEELYELVRWSLMLGVGVMRTPWDMRSGQVEARTWHPGALWFNLTDNEYYLRHTSGELAVQRDSLDWLLVTPYSHKYGRLNGLVRSMSMLYLARQWCFRDRARHSEVHGMPIRQGITPPDADKRAKDNYRTALQSVGTETVIITPQGEPGKVYDVKLVEAKSNSHEVFSAQLDHLDDCMAILVLGQRMSSKGSSGLGSDANPGDAVRQDIMAWLARVIEKFCNRISRRWMEVNHGADQVHFAPRLVIAVEPPADGKKRADEMSVLGDVVAKLEAKGLNVRQLLEAAGVPMLSIQEAAAVAEEAEAKQAEQMAGAAADAKDAKDAADKEQS